MKVSTLSPQLVHSLVHRNEPDTVPAWRKWTGGDQIWNRQGVAALLRENTGGREALG